MSEHKIYYKAFNYFRWPHFCAMIKILDKDLNVLAKIDTPYPTEQKANKKQMKIIKEKIKELGYKEEDLFNGYIV